MTKTTPPTPPEKILFQHDNLSYLWASVMRGVRKDGPEGIGPVVASITGFSDDGSPYMDDIVTKALDEALVSDKLRTCHTVANTIFPINQWNPERPRLDLYSRYLSVSDKVKKERANRDGTYFGRMITSGDEKKFSGNQLEFIIDTFKSRKGVRRSVLQLGIFDSKRDPTTAAQDGFPCMQHLTFSRFDDEIHVNAFYATQHIDTKAYGNYLGLCAVGKFVARELQLRLARVTCFAGIASVGKLNLGTVDKILKIVAKQQEGTNESE